MGGCVVFMGLLLYSLSLLFSVFQGRNAGDASKDLAEMVFRMEAYQLADGGHRKITVFQILNGFVDPDGIKEGHRRLAPLFFEQMVDGGFADTTGLCQFAHGKVLIPMIHNKRNGVLQGLVQRNVRLLHQGQNLLEELVKEGIGLQFRRSIRGQQITDFYQIFSYGLAAADDLRLILELIIVYEAADINDLDLRVAVPLGVAVDVFRDEYNISLVNCQLFVHVNISSMALDDEADAGLPMAAVSPAKVVAVKGMLCCGKL